MIFSRPDPFLGPPLELPAVLVRAPGAGERKKAVMFTHLTTLNRTFQKGLWARQPAETAARYTNSLGEAVHGSSSLPQVILQRRLANSRSLLPTTRAALDGPKGSTAGFGIPEGLLDQWLLNLNLSQNHLGQSCSDFSMRQYQLEGC